MSELMRYIPNKEDILRYYSTQHERPTPDISDGIRPWVGGDNPTYILERFKTVKKEVEPVKIELTSEIKKTQDQVAEEMKVYKKCSSSRNGQKTVKRHKVRTSKKKTTAKRKIPANKKSKDIFNNGKSNGRISKRKSSAA